MVRAETGPLQIGQGAPGTLILETMMPDEEFFLRGKPASELTREELVELVKYLANQIRWYQDQHRGDERVLEGGQR